MQKPPIISSKSRLSAFTLLEITIAMLITAILSAFIYQAFSTFSNLLYTQQKVKADRHVVDVFCYRIKKDCYQARYINMNDVGTVILTDSSGLITYRFEEAFVLRDQYNLHTDTFRVHTAPLNYTFVANLPESIGLIQALDVQLLVDQRSISIPVRKSYTATDLMEANLHQP